MRFLIVLLMGCQANVEHCDGGDKAVEKLEAQLKQSEEGGVRLQSGAGCSGEKND